VILAGPRPSLCIRGGVVNGTWSTSACDTSATVGGCEVLLPSTCGVIWSFAPITAADVQPDCMGLDQSFVTP
jgi:hypothetical protein